MNHIGINGHRIAYKRQGAGSPVLLVHGVASHSFLWEGIAAGLQDHDVIYTDLLGCGASDKPRGGDHSIAVQADILLELIDRLELPRVHLVGHDIGGGIAQIMAVGAEHRIADLALINPVGYDYWPVQPITVMRLPVIRSLTASIMNPHMFRMILRRAIYHKERLDDTLFDRFWMPLADTAGKNGFVQLIRCINNRLLLDITDQLRQLSIATLLIHGGADAYLSREITRRLNEDIPHSTLVHIPRGGHFIQFDEPERITSSLLEFFSGELGSDR